MLQKASVFEFDVTVKGKWKCPICGHINEFEYYHGPYTAPAYDPHDDQCDGCKEFFTMNYFNDDRED